MRLKRSRALLLIAGALWVAHRLRAGPNRKVLYVTIGPRAPRANGVHAHVFAALAALVAFDFPNPIDPIIGGVEGFFGGAIDQIKTWVTSLVRNTFNFLWWIIGSLWDQVAGFFAAFVETVKWLTDTVWNVLASAMHFARYLFDSATSLIWNLVQQALDYAKAVRDFAVDFALSAVANLRDVVYGFVLAIRDGILSVVGAVRDLAWNLAQQAMDFARTIVTQVYEWAHAAIDAAISFLQPLISAVGDFARWLFDNAMSAAHALFDTVTSWAQSLIDLIWSFLYDHVVGPLEDLASYVWDHAKPLLDLLGECIDWIRWLAGVAFDDVVAIIEAPFNVSMRDVLDHIARATKDNTDRVFAHQAESLRR